MTAAASRCRSCGKPVCDCSDPEYQGVVADLARAKAVFQLRAVCTAMGIPQSPRPIPTDRASYGSAVSNHGRAALCGEG
jgi:hypothetical protein